MKRQLFVFVFALFALNAIANTATEKDPFDEFIALEIEKTELEQELFGIPTNGENIISISSIEVLELEEELELSFDTANYLPEGFNAKESANDIDWNTVKLYELEEDVELDFDTKDFLPKNFNPYKGMDCEASIVISFNY